MLSNTYRLCPLEHLDLIPSYSLKRACSQLIELIPTLIGDHLYETFQEEESIWRFLKYLSHSLEIPFSLAPWVDCPLTSSCLNSSPRIPCHLRIDAYQAHLFDKTKSHNSLQILLASQERFIPSKGRKIKWSKKEALNLCLNHFKEGSISSPQLCFLVSDYWDLKLMESYREDFVFQASQNCFLVPTLLHGGLLTPMSYL